MFDTDKIQAVISTKTKAGIDLAAAEVAELVKAARTEAAKIEVFAGALTKAKTADEAINAAISYNVLAFQRATAAFARSVERSAEFSRGYRSDLLGAFTS
ncbi:hypothetical protein GOB57_24960 [Sinorhizobium meliloti]|nr:hypothetical protein [Sinorhizobium meliloti]